MAFAYRSLSFVLFFLILLTVIEATRTNKRYPNDYWRLIDDLKDPKVVDLAKFAVSKHNKNANTHLHFVNVNSCEANNQGSKFKLYIFTTDNDIAGHPRKYVAIVWSRLRLKKNLLILKSFKEVTGQFKI